MFWEAVLLGVVLIAAAINLYDQLPRPTRVAIGLIGTALLVGAVIFL